EIRRKCSPRSVRLWRKTEVRRLEHSPFTTKNYRSLDHILQLAHIARPRMCVQRGEAALRNADDVHSMFAREALAKLFRQQRHVGLSFAQRRYEDRDYIEPRIKILQKFSALDA